MWAFVIGALIAGSFMFYQVGLKIGLERAITAPSSSAAIVKACPHDEVKYDCLLIYTPDRVQSPTVSKWMVAAFCIKCGQEQQFALPIHVVEGQVEATKMRRVHEAMLALGWLWSEEDHHYIKDNR